MTMPLTPEEVREISQKAAQDVLSNNADSPESPAESVPVFSCPVELQPMAKWVQVADGGSCRPCVIAPVVQWYFTELKERGNEPLAQRLEAKVNETDDEHPEEVVQLCEELDLIKQEVDPDTRLRLMDFDCEIQSMDLAALKFEIEKAETNPAP